MGVTVVDITKPPQSGTVALYRRNGRPCHSFALWSHIALSPQPPLPTLAGLLRRHSEPPAGVFQVPFGPAMLPRGCDDLARHAWTAGQLLGEPFRRQPPLGGRQLQHAAMQIVGPDVTFLAPLHHRRLETGHGVRPAERPQTEVGLDHRQHPPVGVVRVLAGKQHTTGRGRDADAAPAAVDRRPAGPFGQMADDDHRRPGSLSQYL